MPMFLTIGYGDEAGYNATTEAVLQAAHANDEALQRGGALIGMAGPPVQVRNHDDGGTRMEPGPYMSSNLPVAGFALIEAASIEDAVRMVQSSPCAVAQGVIEVWPMTQGG